MLKKSFFFAAILFSAGIFAEEFTGTVERSKSGNLAFENPGRIVYLRPIGQVALAGTYDASNNLINKGDLIAQQDTTKQEAKVRSYEAQLKGAMAALEEKKAELERNIKLSEKKAVSQKIYDQTKKDYETAFAEVRKLEAELTTEKYNLEACYLRAPFDGQVEAHLYSEGTWIDHGKEVVTLSLVLIVKIKVPVPESFSGKVSNTDVIKVISPDSEKPVGVWFDNVSMDVNNIYLYVKNNLVPVYKLTEEQKKLPKVHKISFVSRNHDEGGETLWADTNSLKKDENGYYVWRAKDQTMGNPDKPLERQFTVERISVIPGPKYRNIGIYRYRILEKPADLKMHDFVLIDTSENLKHGDVVAYEPRRWMFRPGDKVKVQISKNKTGK